MISKVIVLYHRPPFKKILQNGAETFTERIKPNGIVPLIKNYFSIVGEGIWICWEELEQYNQNHQSINCENYTLKMIPLNRQEIDQFYHRSSKEGFWPILHSFVERFTPDAINWENFLDVNRKFADIAVECCDHNSIVWIHDYNLWMVPYFIRQKSANIKIAFFHHTPFPSSDIFNVLPWREEIINSLLCCDLICFNIPRYVENFVVTAKNIVDVEIACVQEIDKNFSVKGALYQPTIVKELNYNGKRIYLDAIPEGTSVNLIFKELQQNNFEGLSAKIERLKEGRKMIFCVSRIDYIKGVVQMLQAYDKWLDTDQNLVNSFVLCLIAVEPVNGIKAYEDTQREIEYFVGKINGKYSIEVHQPIIFTTEHISFGEMLMFYKLTDIMIIPSLRDGMNITCKEYIVTKNGADGILILSEFAGAAVELDGAVLMNPYYQDSLISAFDTALQMSSEEQTKRMKKLFTKVLESDISIWAQQLLNLDNEILTT